MSERYQCTKENPWDKTKPGRVNHVDVKEVGEQTDGYPGGDLVMMQCTNCGHLWEVELPQ